MARSFLLIGILSLSTLAGSSTAGDGTGVAFLSLNGDQLHDEVSGDGFPLVLVSGGSGMDLRQWDLVKPTLSRSYRIIRYDPRGVGKSDNPSVAYSDADDLDQLLTHLGVEQAGLVGLSSAGGFVLEFAIQYPDRVAGLVAVAPFVPGFEFSASMMARLDRFSQATAQGREPFLDSMFGDAHFIPVPLDRSVRTMARGIMGYNFDKGEGFDPSLQAVLEPPLIEQLAKIRTPVLLLAGELDHPEVLRRNEYLAAQISSVEEKIIVQAGHNGHLENPAAFLDPTKAFLVMLADK